MKKYLYIFLLIIANTFSETKNILFLNSYSRDFKWTEEQIQGVQDSFAYGDGYNFYYEYIDNKNIASDEYITLYKNIFREKYSEKSLDLVVVTDDYALKFMRDNMDLLKKMPYVIASGINSEFSENDNTTIVYEKFDIEKNIQLAKKQNENLKNIYFVTDDSKSSEGIKKDILEYIGKEKNINFYWLSDDYFQLKKELNSIKNNSVIFHLLYFKDSQGISSKYERVIKDLYDKINRPVYMSFNFYLNEENNLLGGYLIDGYKMGSAVGNLMKKFFKGEELPRSISDSSLYSSFQFNGKNIKKYNISYLPKDSVVHYKEKSYFESRKIEVGILLLISVVSIFFIRYYRRDYKREQKLNEQNKAIIELNETLMETQKEIIAVLGQIIENRSEETANHTKRVAKISRFIAMEMGFDEERADLVEIASPLHDVGKIGVPELVLHKPGKLTKEEFEIIKTHSNIGYEILKKSKIPILFAAANIAHEHHERWDGLGYPRGLKEEEISIYARITTAADIFDALLSRRVYKEPWDMREVIDYYAENRGKIFDPKIVDIFLDKIEEIIAIREELKE